MFCSQCGTKNPENSAYCFNCGQKMATPSVPSPPSNSKGIQLADSSGYSVLATLASDAQLVRIQVESSRITMKGEKKEEFVISSSKGKYVARRDRKSTRLNSSHGYISYAVFCLKKKTTVI